MFVLCVLKHITGPEASADSAISGLQDASVVNYNRFCFSSAINYRGAFSSFTCVSQSNQMC